MIALYLRARDLSHVAVYSVHEKPNADADRIDRAEQLVFVREGFSWGAAFFPPIWLAAHGAWAAVAAYCVGTGALVWLLNLLGVTTDWIALAVLAVNILVGFEAATLQRWALELAGWSEAGSVSGRTRDECERRFFDHWLAGEPLLAGSAGQDFAAPGSSAETGARLSLRRLFRRGSG